MNVIEELKFLGKFTQKKIQGGGGVGLGCFVLGGIRWMLGRIEVFVKIKKKNWGGRGSVAEGVRRGARVGWGGQGGCERNVGGRG